MLNNCALQGRKNTLADASSEKYTRRTLSEGFLGIHGNVSQSQIKFILWVSWNQSKDMPFAELVLSVGRLLWDLDLSPCIFLLTMSLTPTSILNCYWCWMRCIERLVVWCHKSQSRETVLINRMVFPALHCYKITP